MAFLRIDNVTVAGMSAAVPAHIEPTVSTTDRYAAEEFVATTGVKEKRWDNRFTTSDLCVPAAEKIISDLEWDKSSIEAVIFVSQTADYILPATSCIIQDRLGLPKSCLALDINLGCSGWVYGLSVIGSLMQTGAIKRGLLLVGDARKHAEEEPDQLFGYAGTATAVEFDEYATPLFFDLGTDGSGFEAIIRPGGGCRIPFDSNSLTLEKEEDGRMRHILQTRMKGMDVFAFGITTAPKSIKRLASHFGFEFSDYDYFVFHQANFKMNETIRRKLKLDESKVPYSMYHFGNTSSASIPLTIVTQLKSEVENTPSKFVCCGFGVGLSWGTVAMETQKLTISKLIEL